MLAREALGQNEINEDGIGDGEARREIERRAVRDAAHQTANHWPESKPETESGADHAHGARALLGSGDIRDIGLRDGNVAAGDAGQNSRDEKERQRGGHAHQDETDRRARDAHHQDGAAAEAVGEFSEDRREDNLHARINAGEPADRDGRRVEIAPRRAAGRE